MSNQSTTPTNEIPLWLKVAIGVAGLFVIAKLIGSDPKPAPDTIETEQKASLSESDSNLEKIRKELAEQEAKERQEYIAKLPALKKNFNFKEDEFNGNGWYTHKNQQGARRTTLLVHVNKNGFIYLESQYHRDSWIFHTHVQVKAGDVVLTSPIIPKFDKNNVTEVGDGVWENVHYLEGVDAIMTLIEINKNKPLKVRFVGDQYHHDITLTEKDKKAIADAMELAKAIKFSES